MAEPLAPEPNTFEATVVKEGVKRCLSPDTDQISAPLIQTGSKWVCSHVHQLTDFNWNKEEFSC